MYEDIFFSEIKEHLISLEIYHTRKSFTGIQRKTLAAFVLGVFIEVVWIVETFWYELY